MGGLIKQGRGLWGYSEGEVVELRAIFEGREPVLVVFLAWGWVAGVENPARGCF